MKTQTAKILTLQNKKTGKKDKYILSLDQLGSGKYGTVYKAVHKDNPNMIFAVKVIRLASQQAKLQCLKQLQIIQAIPKSPNLVETHKQHLQSQKNLYIFQQFCQGGCLKDWLNRRNGLPFKEQQVYDLFFQLSHGYIDLYRKGGILHQDIKPHNILLKGKRFKFCDFGVSQFAHKLKTSNTRKGTVSYMPPEKLKLNFLPNPKSDIYSLGITIYQVIFGHHPYLAQKTKDFKQYLQKMKIAQLKPIYQLREKIIKPSIKFDSFLRFLLKMINLKVQHRVSLEELQQLVTKHEPFISMKIPSEEESINFNMTQNEFNNYKIINQSKIVMRASLSQQNPLINVEKSIHKNQMLNQQQIRQQILKSIEFQHKLIQQVISYCSQGISNLKQSKLECVYQNNKKVKASNENLKLLEICPSKQNIIDIFTYCVLYLNKNIMVNFKNHFLQYLDFNTEQLLDQQIQYVKAQQFKFIVEGLISQQTALSQQLRSLKARQIVISLTNQLYQSVQSIQINCKYDMLGLMFLKQLSNVLSLMGQLDCLNNNSQKISSSFISSEKVQKIKLIIKNYEYYQTLRKQKLKQCFYAQVSKDKELIYDFEENSDEFIDISQMLQDLQMQSDEQK